MMFGFNVDYSVKKKVGLFEWKGQTCAVAGVPAGPAHILYPVLHVPMRSALQRAAAQVRVYPERTPGGKGIAADLPKRDCF